MDALDGTPLLDIRPFVPEFDLPVGDVSIGWLAGRLDSGRERLGDDRFQP